MAKKKIDDVDMVEDMAILSIVTHSISIIRLHVYWMKRMRQWIKVNGRLL